MMIVHKLEMDLTKRGPMPRIDVVQGDKNTRVAELTLSCGGQPWPVPQGTVVWMRYRKADGTKGVYDTLPEGEAAWTTVENVIQVTLAPQMLTAPGTVLAQVELVKEVTTVATFTIQIGVEANPAADALESEDYMNMLQWMGGQLERLLTEAKESGEFDGPPGESVAVFDYVQAAGYSGTEEAFRQELITPHLPLTGGTLTGTLNMGGQRITGLAAPVENSEPVTLAYLAGKRATITVSVPLANWTTSAPYRQSIAVEGLVDGDWVMVMPVYTGTLSTDLNYKRSFDYISDAKVQDGQLNLVCIEKKPLVNMHVRVEVIR